MSALDATKPTAIESDRMLIGEGVEEKLFFQAFLKHLGVDGGVQVEDYGGKDKLGGYLKTLKNRPGFERLVKLGVTRDADDDPNGVSKSLGDLIRNASLPANLTVTKFILPGLDQKGALENIFLKSIVGQPIEGCVETYMECAGRATGKPHTSSSNMAKARVHSWLAAQDPPDLRLGLAAAKGLIDWDSPVFGDLKAFLQDLA